MPHGLAKAVLTCSNNNHCLPQLLQRGKPEVFVFVQALGLKMRQICFVEKETFLADQHRDTAAKLLKVCGVAIG